MKKIMSWYARLSLQSKISVVYSLLIFVSLSVTLIATFRIGYKNLERTIDASLRNTAIMTASNSLVIDALRRNQPDDQVSAYCDKVLAGMENVDIITICNPEGTRLYHRDKEKIGAHIVGNDEGRMLETHTNYFNTAIGTLGLQRRYFHAVFDRDGRFVGFICASVLLKNLESVRNQLLLAYFIIGLAALILTCLAASRIHAFLLRLLFGYEPEQIANMVIQHQEVLDTLEEGILAIDRNENVSLLNSAAVQMLSITDPDPIGKNVLDVFPESLLPTTLATRKTERNVNLKLRNIHLITSRIPVMEKGELIGAVSIFRNQTQVIKLSEQLTGVNHIVDAMRAYTHEFNNKLHVILGLIQCGYADKAMDYIMHVSDLQKTKIGFIMKTIKLPNLCALLIGKMSRANELDIAMEIDENSYVDEVGAFLPTNTVNTIVGNLLENAMESINQSDRSQREIHITLFYDKDKFYFDISDTGCGISKENCKHIFEDGFSTKGPHRGTGLFLVKDLIEANHGEIQVESEENNGTIFTVSIKNNRVEKESRHDSDHNR